MIGRGGRSVLGLRRAGIGRKRGGTERGDGRHEQLAAIDASCSFTRHGEFLCVRSTHRITRALATLTKYRGGLGAWCVSQSSHEWVQAPENLLVPAISPVRHRASCSE